MLLDGLGDTVSGVRASMSGVVSSMSGVKGVNVRGDTVFGVTQCPG